MERCRKTANSILIWIALVLFLLMVILAFCFTEPTWKVSMVIGTAGFAGVFFAMRLCVWSGWWDTAARRRLLLGVILLTAFALRAGCLIFTEIQPIFDFSVYHDIARSLSLGQMTQNDYIAVFPHVVGYPFFLSLFYRIFGPNPLVAYWLNLVLQLVGILLTYGIARRLFCERVGLLTTFLLAFLPSGILFVPTASSDPLFACLLFCLLYAYVRFWRQEAMKHTVLRDLLFYFAFGAGAAVTGAIRPFALIVLLAVLGMELFFRKGWEGKRLVRLVGLAAMVGIYLLAGTMISAGIGNAVGREVAQGGIGYSIKVGMNQQSQGQYNEPDSQRFRELYTAEGISASAAHQQMLTDAIEEVRENAAGLPELLRQKIWIEWGNDAYAPAYMKAALYMSGVLTQEGRAMFQWVDMLCNVYYYALVLFAACGLFRIFRQGGDDWLPLLLVLLFLGTFACHLLVEVHARYHYYIVPIIAAFAAYGLGWQKGFAGKEKRYASTV